MINTKHEKNIINSIYIKKKCIVFNGLTLRYKIAHQHPKGPFDFERCLDVRIA